MPKFDDYSYKKHDDLLKDEKYLLWRLSPTEQLDDYWNDLRKTYPSLNSEIELADNYLKKNIFKKRILKTEKKEAILREIRLSVEQRGVQKRRKIRAITQWVKYGVAASILALLGFFLYEITLSKPEEQIIVNRLDTQNIQLITSGKTALFEENVNIKIDNQGVIKVQSDNQAENEELIVSKSVLNKLVVPYGKRSKITLADGTLVWLNSGSTLEFPSQFEENKREISLTGEMYIEVAKNKKAPFRVHTSDFNVNVLGTKFNVSAYEKQTQSVVLVEGSVSLKAKDANAGYPLKPNEIAFLENLDSFRKEETDASKHISWINGYIILNQTPVSDMLAYIERYYNLSFEFVNLHNTEDLTCNGKLFLSDNLDNVIKSVAIILDMKYRKENNKIYITNK